MISQYNPWKKINQFKLNPFKKRRIIYLRMTKEVKIFLLSKRLRSQQLKKLTIYSEEMRKTLPPLLRNPKPQLKIKGNCSKTLIDELDNYAQISFKKLTKIIIVFSLRSNTLSLLSPLASFLSLLFFIFFWLALRPVLIFFMTIALSSMAWMRLSNLSVRSKYCELSSMQRSLSHI